MKKTYKVILLKFVVFMLLLQGCKEPKEDFSIEPVQEKRSQIVVLTSSDDQNDPIYISKLRSFENFNSYEFFTNKEKDTLKLEAEDWNLILVSTRNSFRDSLLVRSGDTLLLSLKKNHFTKKLKNRPLEKWSYYEMEGNGLKEEADSLYGSLLRIDVENPIELALPDFKVRTYRLIPDERTDAAERVPTLVDKYRKLIYSNRKKDLSKVDDASKEKLINGLVERKIFSDLAVLNSFFYSSEIEKFLLSDTFLSDSIANIYNEYGYLSSLYHKNLFRKGKAKGGAYANNIPIPYDSIPYFVKEIWVEKARMIYLEDLARNQKDMKALKRDLKKFHEEYNNVTYKNHLESKYLIDLKSLYNSPLEVSFVDAEGAVSNLNKLKDSLKGKIIYVDYWASWCGPCIRAMPAAKKLRSDYKDRAIEFVYFSVDNNKDHWLKASNEDKIALKEHNYLVLNHDASSLKNKLKIDRIPRYLIFNKDGELVDHEAPGPETEEIREQLDKLLGE